VDKATLVRSDLDIGGRVMLALSRSRIPVTLCNWNYVPQLDEWQLVIATPWYDSKGPHETFSKVVSALQHEGIYAEAPIRRIFIKSPHDPLVKALEQETKIKSEGAIHIVDYGNHSYSLVFAPFTGPGGAVPAKHISGEQELRDFLENSLHIPRSSVDEALSEIARRRSGSIFHVRLTTREAKTLGLA
jgi:hypothetical protein